MEKLLEILEEIAQGADVGTCTTLIDDHILDSFAILSLVSELEEEFDIEISPAELIPDNFNSAQKLWEMVCRLKGDN
ncbi:MAG: acyl carrier protein [Clostridium sp.]|nr:acyl carrier protein [Clostridium sp.]MCM1398491.1 acyl carrier protein [Clostridium sp.]MCM1460213.1 acyl carrier protein [Bacteroides sp.]